MLTKYFILFNLESFFKLFTSFWYTLYFKVKLIKNLKLVELLLKFNKKVMVYLYMWYR